MTTKIDKTRNTKVLAMVSKQIPQLFRAHRKQHTRETQRQMLQHVKMTIINDRVYCDFVIVIPLLVISFNT